MYVNKNLNLNLMWRTGGGHLVWITAWSTCVLFLYIFLDLKWIPIPWIAVGVVGTAVSFYIGFKNNQAYDRMWEARKIWGGIVNISRMWGSNLRGYISSEFTTVDKELINDTIKKLVYRHISYLYALRNQLLIPAPWEHVSLNSHVASVNKKRMEKFGIGMVDNSLTENMFQKYNPYHENLQ